MLLILSNKKKGCWYGDWKWNMLLIVLRHVLSIAAPGFRMKRNGPICQHQKEWYFSWHFVYFLNKINKEEIGPYVCIRNNNISHGVFLYVLASQDPLEVMLVSQWVMIPKEDFIDMTHLSCILIHLPRFVYLTYFAYLVIMIEIEKEVIFCDVSPLDELAKFRRHASRVHFTKILFRNSKVSPTDGQTNGRTKSMTYQPTNGLTWLGARSTRVSKNKKCQNQKEWYFWYQCWHWHCQFQCCPNKPRDNFPYMRFLMILNSLKEGFSMDTSSVLTLT